MSKELPYNTESLYDGRVWLQTNYQTTSMVFTSFMHVMYANMQPENADSSGLLRVFRSTCTGSCPAVPLSQAVYSVRNMGCLKKCSHTTKSCLGENSLNVVEKINIFNINTYTGQNPTLKVMNSYQKDVLNGFVELLSCLVVYVRNSVCYILL